LLFEQTELAADRRLRQSQLFAGFGNADLLGNGPEIEKVVII
jgi:hypothetical protein